MKVLQRTDGILRHLFIQQHIYGMYSKRDRGM